MTSSTFHDATAHPTGAPGFRTVLVANRGEIACRVIGTLRRLGVRSVAVFSDADADARHVREADVAVRLGPAPAAQSYLDVDAVVAAAVATGAEAVHPGYGFLSENPALARACERAGIAFVGPDVDALEAMADKLAAKSIVGARGVPVVPGAGEPGMSDDDLLAAAGAVGFPLLVKPSAGGGGKGMVVVRAEADLPRALASARRVAASSFGDDTLLLERLVEAPRHIEVQVLADTHGTVVHLGERECSLQRRHQKVVEEAPSPLLTAEQRARMGEAACEVARSVGYVGAGTVEFLVPAASPDEFFFIEMNTRLQVEHPVTEMVTDLDLVALQLRVAAGEPLGLAQDDVVLRGHAVEARLYAESPDRGFLPATGSVLVYDDGGVPSGPGTSPLRLDSGISAAAVVGGHYDPMLAKAVAWGETRDEAVERLDGLLARTVVLGVETNTAFLRSLLADDDVRAGRLDTGLIDRLVASVVGPGEGPGGPDWVDLVAAALFLVEQAVVARPGGGTGHSRLLAAGMAAAGDPWRVGDGWRLNGGAARASLVRDPGADGAWWLTLDGVRERVRLALDAPSADGEPATVWVWRDGRTVALAAPDREQRAARARADRRRARGDAPGATDPEVRAAMPGTVVTAAADGEPVTAGDVLVTVEAMKMEHPLLAPHDGVADVRVRPGDLVRRDQVVAVVHPHDSGAAQPAAPVPQPDTQGAS